MRVIGSMATLCEGPGVGGGVTVGGGFTFSPCITGKYARLDPGVVSGMYILPYPAQRDAVSCAGPIGSSESIWDRRQEMSQA